MAEIIYQFVGDQVGENISNIRWLSRDKSAPFNRHLSLCSPKALEQSVWNKRYDEGTILLINHCAALETIGEYQKAFDILSSINIDKYSGILPVTKIVYYNNLMGIYTDLGKFEQADLLYSNILLMFQDVKNMKQKQLLKPILLRAKILDRFR